MERVRLTARQGGEHVRRHHFACLSVIMSIHYIQYLTKRSHSICAAEQHVNAIRGSSHEHKFSSDIQQLIKGGQTFGGRVYLIELRSDIELSKGGERKGF